MNREKINTLVNAASNLLNDQETFLLPVLAAKLRKASETYPQDRTIIGVADILANAESKKKLLITRGELKDLYQKLYSNHTAFATVCKEELGELPGLATPKYATKNEKQDQPFNLYEGADKTLSKQLDNAFAPKASYNLFNRDTAEHAKLAVNTSLEIWNLKASKLAVNSGNEHFIVVQADYQTPKGTTSILVPVEVQNGSPALPEVFMGNEGPQELNHINIKSYVTSHAGVKLAVKAQDVVAILTQSITKKASLNPVEAAITKLAASRSTAVPYYGDAVLGQKMNEVGKPDIQVQKSGQFESFAEKIKSPLGQANMKFGTEKVNLGRDVVVRSLIACGAKNPQVNLVNSNDTTIVYAASLNSGKVCFTVPVKFQNNRVINPEVLVCNGSVKSLSEKTIRSLFAKNEKDYTAASVCSPQYGLKPDELISNIRTALAEDNYSKAEDALNVLAECGNQKAYQAGFVVYMNGLSGMNKTASKEEVSCSMVVKSASTDHPVCGHTGLPLHKVCQDKYGNCQPLYRRSQAESFEVPNIITSKAFSQ